MRRLLAALCLAAAVLALPAAAAGDYADIRWEDLVPKGWDPAAELKGLDLDKLSDADPRAMEALQKMKSAFDAAPTEPAMAGRRVRLPGFLIPLDPRPENVREFLLVPYFGACIHTPPPPANQIIHGVAAGGKGLGKLRSMDPVWAEGTLSIRIADTPWGKAGYRLTVDRVKPYEEPARRK